MPPRGSIKGDVAPKDGTTTDLRAFLFDLDGDQKRTSTGERTRNLHIPWPLANFPSSILGSGSGL